MSDASPNSTNREREVLSEDELSNERTDDPPKKKGDRVDNNEETQPHAESNRASVAQPGQKLQAKWDEMFGRLLKYKSEHGHCLVPNRYAEDPQLGSWVSTQRRHYKLLTSGDGDTTPMTPARARKLEEIGFKWATKDPRHVPWKRRYDELVAFKEKYGHSQVPIGWEENIKLSNWVSTQRQEYKLIQSGRQSRLSEDKIALLDDLDFIWEAQRGGPRRKRKATVVVPSKPNPVDARKLKAKVATRGGKAGASVRGGSVSVRQTVKTTRKKDGSVSENLESKDTQGSNQQNQLPIQQQRDLAINGASLTGMNAGIGAAALVQSAYIPGIMQAGISGAGVHGLQLATGTVPQWQLLNNGAFQSNIPQSMGLASGQFFPLATQVQIAQPGFQFSSVPIDPSRQMQHAAFSAFQHNPQTAALIFNHPGAFQGSMGIQNFQQSPFQLQQLYAQGGASHQHDQAQNRQRFQPTKWNGESHNKN